ncbi:hypothetical protein B4U45_18335 [Mycobacterium persicum]|nr:hypothetical protein A4G31_17210 [Mycobacterium persicum]ORB40470.1 hypothetical protein BST40_21920 [Mycobacterium persicum]ORB96246.1 hypothetical protein B1T44_19035 [Mycobacterium persicum]ORC02957.1 hypothetical protein B1T48_18565 [Mycobacterium persicum]ORC08267.1 hypothetical protein B4U45_18335 [Mycobacterium persicum]
MPPQILGLDDQARAARLALAVFDNDRARYDAALADSLGHGPELIYALVRCWAAGLVEHHGTAAARVRVERMLAGITEHLEELSDRHIPRVADDFDGDVW